MAIPSATRIRDPYRNVLSGLDWGGIQGGGQTGERSAGANAGYGAAMAASGNRTTRTTGGGGPEDDNQAIGAAGDGGGSQSFGPAVTPQQITNQLNGQQNTVPGGNQSPTDIGNYYGNSYQYQPSVQAPPVNAQWQNEPQPANTLSFIGEVGDDGVNSSTAPEILAARQASLNAAPNPNTPPSGAVPIPGFPGHYQTRSGTWSPPGTGGGPGGGNNSAWIQALRDGGPAVQPYLQFMRQNGMPLFSDNPTTEANYLSHYGITY